MLVVESQVELEVGLKVGDKGWFKDRIGVRFIVELIASILVGVSVEL